MDLDKKEMYNDINTDQFSGDDTDFDLDDSSYSIDIPIAVQFPYEILSADDIVQHMLNYIEGVNVIVQLPATITRILLNYFNWDVQKLLDRYYSDNQEKLFKELNLSNIFIKDIASEGIFQNASEYCEICCVTLPASMLTALGCGHRFCKNCWNDYLKIKIMNQEIVQTIECAAHLCSVLVDDMTVVKLVNDPMARLKYQLQITNSFVNYNKLLKRCPTPGCDHVIKVQYTDAKPVTCLCNRTFCFGCSKNWHAPISCNILQKWLTTCKDSSEMLNWTPVNTKDCPNCKATVEKLNGCNYMKCLECESSFCWFCLHRWDYSAHTWTNCNSFDEKKITTFGNAQVKYKTELERFPFYIDKYLSHKHSLQFENNLYKKVEEKMEEMQERNRTWIGVQFLKTAVDILCSCRETLMYTYVFAFYVKKNIQTEIFEYNQKNLENSIEILSDSLEQDLREESLNEMKLKVQNKYRYCDTKRRVLLEHIYEGNNKHWWEFRDV